jgi:hypothetical protein
MDAMTATEHLSPAQFFHGTSAHWESGDMIDPNQAHAKTFNVSQSDRVYFTSDPARASFYADRAAEKHGGEPRVYQVEPTGQHIQDLQTRSPENRQTKHPLRVVGAVNQVDWKQTHHVR